MSGKDGVCSCHDYRHESICLNRDATVVLVCIQPKLGPQILFDRLLRPIPFPFSTQDLDETHLFIDPEIVPVLQEKIDGLMDKLYFSVINE